MAANAALLILGASQSKYSQITLKEIVTNLKICFFK